MRRAVLVCSIALIAAASCSKHTVINDPVFARKVADAVYAGSLSSIKDSLSPKCELDDTWAKDLGGSVRPEFGEIKDVKLNTWGEKTATTQEMIWTVTTERSTFLMQLIFDRDGKLLSIQFNY